MSFIALRIFNFANYMNRISTSCHPFLAFTNDEWLCVLFVNTFYKQQTGSMLGYHDDFVVYPILGDGIVN